MLLTRKHTTFMYKYTYICIFHWKRNILNKLRKHKLVRKGRHTSSFFLLDTFYCDSTTTENIISAPIERAIQIFLIIIWATHALRGTLVLVVTVICFCILRSHSQVKLGKNEFIFFSFRLFPKKLSTKSKPSKCMPFSLIHNSYL